MCPSYSFERDDIIREKELGKILEDASEISRYGLPGPAWECLIAILWLYGKRISEIIPLTFDNVRVGGKFLTINFRVLKKKTQTATAVKRTYRKQVTIENPYTEYVKRWWLDLATTGHEYIFPRPQTATGHIHREYAWHVCKEISPKISPHLFRHSLATKMAEEGATAPQLMAWFDWDRADTAMGYIRRAGLMSGLSDRIW